MCKTWTIHYACTHTRQIRLSTCRGTYAFRNMLASGRAETQGDDKAAVACTATPCLLLAQNTQCGPCARAQAEKALEEEEKRTTIPDVDGSDDADRYASRLWKIQNSIPDQWKKRKLPLPGLGRSRPKGIRGSRLQGEVRPDDIADSPQDEQLTGESADDGWSSPGWSTTPLEEDVADGEDPGSDESDTDSDSSSAAVQDRELDLAVADAGSREFIPPLDESRDAADRGECDVDGGLNLSCADTAKPLTPPCAPDAAVFFRCVEIARCAPASGGQPGGESDAIYAGSERRCFAN